MGDPGVDLNTPLLLVLSDFAPPLFCSSSDPLLDPPSVVVRESGPENFLVDVNFGENSLPYCETFPCSNSCLSLSAGVVMGRPDAESEETANLRALPEMFEAPPSRDVEGNGPVFPGAPGCLLPLLGVYDMNGPYPESVFCRGKA